MESSVLLEVSRVIGTGLEAQNCRLEIKSIGGDGLLWQHQSFAEGIGIWVPLSDWKKAVSDNTGISVLDKLPEDFVPCISAAIFEIVGQWLVDSVSETPSAHILEQDVYPILTLNGVRCVLVQWPVNEWQPMVSHWAPCITDSPSVSLSLIAGYIPQTQSEPELPEAGNGLWLDAETDIELGQALLWWQRPLAKVRIQDDPETGEKLMLVEEVLTEIDFHYPPLLAELASVSLSLADVGTMAEGEGIPVKFVNHGQLSLCRQTDASHKENFAHICLLRSPDGLIAKVL
ncbi:hypothetical protein D5018_10415 [Parashewanella curva]|uniref:YscQ/HrcQ family type III secretion apparatus protein n=1 Tax=Parashewanella curva TaxID=2338552 RepID=A0A3L8PYW0_9GAMM|nr:hypothetical protein [Parashewanella curva]RLV59773.1 hypothetical protein D5018_10415 [Parashewanella curva]